MKNPATRDMAAPDAARRITLRRRCDFNCGSASTFEVRWMPLGVTSKTHARTSVAGKPTNISAIAVRITELGISKTGRTWDSPCASAQLPTMYAMATRKTFRLFNSSKKPLIKVIGFATERYWRWLDRETRLRVHFTPVAKTVWKCGLCFSRETTLTSISRKPPFSRN